MVAGEATSRKQTYWPTCITDQKYPLWLTDKQLTANYDKKIHQGSGSLLRGYTISFHMISYQL